MGDGRCVRSYVARTTGSDELNVSSWRAPPGGAGIRLAYQTAREKFVEGGNNRVILATDGDESLLLSRAVPYVEAPISQASRDFRFADAVAEFGLLLRDSAHKADASFDQVLALAESSGTAAADDTRFESLHLVRTARQLSTEEVLAAN